VTHPANVHLFKGVVGALRQRGGQTLVVSRDKDVTVSLLERLGIEHEVLSRKGHTMAGMAVEMAARTGRLYRRARQFRPDVMVAAEGGVSIGPVGAALGLPRVVFAQVDRALLQNTLGLPWATVICTGTGYRGDHGRKQVRFHGFQTQAYLDPRRFRPDPGPLRRAGVDPDAPYIVLRMVGWTAAHDVGRRGPREQRLRQAVETLSGFGRVLISSESALPESLQPWHNPVDPIALHDLLAFARLCVAEGGTVPVEAALLGVPSVACNTYPFGYISALAQRGLFAVVDDLAQAVERGRQMLADPRARQAQRQRAEQLYADTDDVLETMVNVIERAARGAAAREGWP
jgi:predicted glycosyltransferase